MSSQAVRVLALIVVAASFGVSIVALILPRTRKQALPAFTGTFLLLIGVIRGAFYHDTLTMIILNLIGAVCILAGYSTVLKRYSA